jgi:uncharacterized repeat protein (TIGR02543 family)
LAYVGGDPVDRRTQLNGIRLDSQKYDSGGNLAFEIDDEDAYVDLIDLVEQLQDTITDADVISAANTVSETLRGIQPFLIYEHHASGQFQHYDPVLGHDRAYVVDIDDANGIGIYYPPRSTTQVTSTYRMYIEHRLFDTTRDSGWTRFLADGLPPQGPGNPPPMPSDILLTALLPSSPATYTLAVNVDPATGGIAEPPGITTHAEGATVPLTATANAGWQFAGWSGDTTDPDDPTISVVMDDDKVVTATFTPVVLTHTLTVDIDPAGSGVVSSVFGGIDCEDSCAYDYPQGSVITLTATANSTWWFTGWDGACSNADGVCIVTMDASHQVTARFVNQKVYLPIVHGGHSAP